MSDHLGENLKLACSHYRSISEVCRQLQINRAQFNKYLSGQSRPTPFNLKRIGDFFGVEDYELGLPPEQFARLIGARASQSGTQANDPLLRYKEVFISLGGVLSKVYRTEVSLEEYLTYTTEQTEKIKVQQYAQRLGSMQAAVATLAKEMRQIS